MLFLSLSCAWCSHPVHVVNIMDCGRLVSPPAPFGLMDQGMMAEGLNVRVSIFACLCVAVGARTSSLVCIHLYSNVRPFMCERTIETTLGGSWQEVTVLTSGPPKLPSKHTSTIKAVNNNHKCPVQVCFSPA